MSSGDCTGQYLRIATAACPDSQSWPPAVRSMEKKKWSASLFPFGKFVWIVTETTVLCGVAAVMIRPLLLQAARVAKGMSFDQSMPAVLIVHIGLGLSLLSGSLPRARAAYGTQSDGTPWSDSG